MPDAAKSGSDDVTMSAIDYIEVDFGFTNSGSSAACETVTNVGETAYEPRMSEVVDAWLYGSGWALSRCTGGRYSPPSSGWYDIKLPYYLLGNTMTATTTVYAFKRNHTRSNNTKKTFQTPIGKSDSDFIDYGKWYLNADHEYNLGFEIHGEASATGAASFSDYHYYQKDGRQRHANLRTGWLDVVEPA